MGAVGVGRRTQQTDKMTIRNKTAEKTSVNGAETQVLKFLLFQTWPLKTSTTWRFWKVSCES